MKPIVREVLERVEDRGNDAGGVPGVDQPVLPRSTGIAAVDGQGALAVDLFRGSLFSTLKIDPGQETCEGASAAW